MPTWMHVGSETRHRAMLEVGDRVTASAFGGGFAEYAVAAADATVKIPDALDMNAAAGFVVNYTTAWHGLLDRGQLAPGETLLVLGAAGGTGIAAIQVGRMAGARVIAGASTQEKRDYALAHGAHETIDYTRDDWRKRIKALTDGRGVDVVFDTVGGDVAEQSFRCIARNGRHVMVGFSGGIESVLNSNSPTAPRRTIVQMRSRCWSRSGTQAQPASVMMYLSFGKRWKTPLSRSWL